MYFFKVNIVIYVFNNLETIFKKNINNEILESN